MDTTHTFPLVRVHGSFLADIEKRTLVGMARRLPRRVNSDHLTGLALAAMGLAGAGFWASRWNVQALYLVILGLILNWFGDSLDGTLARVRGQERPRYGYYVDHVVDLIGTTVLVAGMAASPFMSAQIGLALLVAYLLVTAEVFLAASAHGTFRMSFLKVGPTELRIILAIGTIYALYKPLVKVPGLGVYPLFDVGAVVAIAGLVFTLLISAARNTRHMYLAEPIRLPQSSGARAAGSGRRVRP
jgi:phosphatidylglycerophosphate synthase